MSCSAALSLFTLGCERVNVGVVRRGPERERGGRGGGEWKVQAVQAGTLFLGQRQVCIATHSRFPKIFILFRGVKTI